MVQIHKLFEHIGGPETIELLAKGSIEHNVYGSVRYLDIGDFGGGRVVIDCEQLELAIRLDIVARAQRGR